MFARPSRRAFASGAFGAAALVWALRGRALGRLPVQGRVALRVPWPLASIDPHRLEDATAALLGAALFDTLYALTPGGRAVPALAEADPVADGSFVRVVVREGVESAAGRPMGARQVASSIARARGLGAKAWLSEVPPPKVEDARTLRFGVKDPALVARVLASPLVAIVPEGFSPERPDGTGPFRATKEADALVLRRNPLAAMGPSLLDEIVVRAEPDLASSLRAFESGEDDVGWLGSGLHEPRPGSRTFDAGMIAWAVLRTGRDAGSWDAPGVAQRLCDGTSPARLAYLALGAPWPTERDLGWGGAPCDLVVREDSPWLVELSRALAASLSRPSHEVTSHPISTADLSQRRSSRSYALALDVVRPFAPGALGALSSLASADDLGLAADMLKYPPRLGDASPRVLTRTMRLGVVGEIRAQGGRSADVALALSPGGGVDFGMSTRSGRVP